MLIAGLDVGNATTEVVLALEGRHGLRPIGAAHARTSGRKGSEESLQAARRLLEKAEAEAGMRSDAVVLCDLHPVDTLTLPMRLEADPQAPVRQLGGGGSQTPAGRGLASGSHLPLDRLEAGAPGAERVIVSVPGHVDYEHAAMRLDDALAAGWQIAGVLLGGDDAVLVHKRLALDVPIVDEVDLTGLRTGAAVALEVALEGQGVAALCDPAALARALGLTSDRLPDVAKCARELLGRRAVAVARVEADEPPRLCQVAARQAVAHLLVEIDGRASELELDADLPRALAALPPGCARMLRLAGNGVLVRLPVRDAWVANLRALDHSGWLRRGVAALDQAPLAALSDLDPPSLDLLEHDLGRPVRLTGSEAQAAARGARTTPGAPRDAVVLDIGGGTIDLADGMSVVSAAGAGELMSAAVAATLGVPRGLAERVKRGSALRIISPHLAEHEDGSRRFLSPPAAGASVGRLALDDATLTPFAVDMALAEWRALRHALKEQVIGANVKRCLDALRHEPGTLLVCGGGALDRELVAMIGERLRRDGWVVARAEVAGRYGPRFAVAWGALLDVCREQERVAA
jgi:Diol dehydratase reactivase ATPase-like domain/DD-reactivating factor swiveling domain